MGLINWFKDKAFRQLEHQVALQDARMEAIELRMQQLKGQIISVRRTKSRDEDDEQRPENPNNQMMKDLEEVRRAFGGDLPIELIEKYKNAGML